jgi:hypothetical protein
LPALNPNHYSFDNKIEIPVSRRTPTALDHTLIPSQNLAHTVQFKRDTGFFEGEFVRTRIVITTIALLLSSCSAKYSSVGDLTDSQSRFNSPGSDGRQSTSGTDLTAQPMTIEEIQEACAKYAIQKTSQPISFGQETNTCPWNTADNLDQKDQFYQTRIEQTQNVVLPPGALICGMRLLTQSNDFNYDDEFLLDFKGLVLASSATFTNFNKDFFFYRYDWSRIKGQAWSSMPMTSYCAGSDRGLASCSWPDTSTNGPLILSYDDLVIQEMSSVTSQDPNHQFRMTVTGDNDPQVDCHHAPVEFQVEISYVQ